MEALTIIIKLQILLFIFIPFAKLYSSEVIFEERFDGNF